MTDIKIEMDGAHTYGSKYKSGDRGSCSKVQAPKVEPHILGILVTVVMKHYIIRRYNKNCRVRKNAR